MKRASKSKVSWLVTNDEGWWWIPKLKVWRKIDDIGGHSFSNFAKPKTKFGALVIARKCPAKRVLIVMRCGRKTKKWPNGWERESYFE